MEHLLFEHAGGYGLFEVKEYEDMSRSTYDEYMKLTQVVNFKSGMRFEGLETAMEHLQSLSRGEVHDDLRKFLELNEVKVLHCDESLRKGLEAIGILQRSSRDIMRGVRRDFRKLMRLEDGDESQMVLGLAYGYSREKVEYNVKREDCIVIHTVMLLEQVDKDINSYTMRIREIYGWVFPELGGLLKDNHEYVEAVRSLVAGEMDGEEEGTWTGICKERAEEIMRLRRGTMGMKLSQGDITNLRRLIEIVDEKIEVRRSLEEYLKEKMSLIAPNLAAILGDVLGARLISQAGGLFSLGKAPASTFQLLGAEKSLFRALKMKQRTPKYGLIYGSGWVSKVREKDKGRMSRYIATKCSIAAKIDCFSKDRAPHYGVELKSLIDKKIRSLQTNEEVERTTTVVQRVFDKIHGVARDDGPSGEEKAKKDLRKDSKHRKKASREAPREEFKFGERKGKGGAQKDDKRVSFDLTRNDVKETERAPKRFEKRG